MASEWAEELAFEIVEHLENNWGVGPIWNDIDRFTRHDIEQEFARLIDGSVFWPNGRSCAKRRISLN